MKAAVSTKGKTAQLRYELPHRVHDAKVYPVKAPNGSTVALYGHEYGVRIVWRGGRPLKHTPPAPNQPAKPAKVNGTSNDAIMIIDSDDEEPSPAKTAPEPPKEAEYESEEEELDPSEPYTTVIQHLDLSLNTEVLHIAVPHVPAASSLRPTETVPAIFEKKIVFTVACSDYTVRIITLPLGPPSTATKDRSSNTKARWGEEVVTISSHAGHQTIPSGVTMTWTSNKEPTFDETELEEEDAMETDEDEEVTATPRRRRMRRRHSRSRSAKRDQSEGWDLLLASHSTDFGGLLKVWRFAIAETSIKAPSPITPYQVLNLGKPASSLTFNTAHYPKRRHSQLLITDSAGNARIYDPFATSSRQRRAARSTGVPSEPGTYVAIFRTTFDSAKHTPLSPPNLVRRKAIIDAAWASDGRSIIALLYDGEWGIWDVDRSGPKPPADPAAFSLRGFIGNTESIGMSNGAASPKTRNTRNTLAPMTPRTRKTREENLFQGPVSTSTQLSRGGISVASLQSASGGAPEDSVIVWYANDAYRVPNLNQFWSRASSGSGYGGSLYGSGFSKIQDLALHGESITSMDQFAITHREARMAIPRDVLIAGEHRLVITTNANPSSGLNLTSAFQKERTEEEETRRADQALLTAGELDLGGMDRLLDEMDGGGMSRSLVLGNSKKVNFMSSAN